MQIQNISKSLMCFLHGDVSKIRCGLHRNRIWFAGLAFVLVAWICVSSALVYQLGGLHYTLDASANIQSSVSPWHAIYFTIVNITTVGFGDFFPTTEFGRILAVINGLFGWLWAGIIIIAVTDSVTGEPDEAGTLSADKPEKLEGKSTGIERYIYEQNVVEEMSYEIGRLNGWLESDRFEGSGRMRQSLSRLRRLSRRLERVSRCNNTKLSDS